MSTESHEPGHGHSAAAWTAVIIMLVGFTAGTIVFFLNLPWAVLVSGGIVLMGLLVGVVMSKMGYGVNGSKYASGGH
jgi:hypothetical protein